MPKLIADTLQGVGFTLVGGGAQTDLDKAGARQERCKASAKQVQRR